MIIEEAGGGGPLNLVFIGLAVAGGIGFLVFWLRSRLLVGTLFLLAGAGALVAPMVLETRSKAALTPPFAVVVLTNEPAAGGVLRHDGLRGGVYQRAGDHRRIPLRRQAEWPHRATLIVNDSDRLVTVRRFHYAASAWVSAGAPLIEVVLPGERAVIAGRVHDVLDEGTAPPETIRSSELATTLDILYRSTGPYDPAVHGSRAALLRERDAGR